MKESYLHLVVVILCFSHLVFLNGIPLSRTRSMMLDSQGQGSPENFELMKTDEVMVTERTERRLDIELNDYPGAGSNNRHTPNPKRGCVDC